MDTISEKFGSLVFNDRVMKERLSTEVYNSLKRTIEEQTQLDISIAKEVANAICEENGNVLKFKGNAKVGDELRITKDVSLLDAKAEHRKKVIKVNVFLDEQSKLCLESEGILVKSNEPIEKAKNCPTDRAEIVANLNKTDVYPFLVECEIKIENEEKPKKRGRKKAFFRE